MNDRSHLDVLFSPLELANMTLPNRFIRSATYEGQGDENGIPGQALAALYSALARGDVGTIITGFAFISREGRAMQPGQCGIDGDDKIAPWHAIASAVHQTAPDVRLIMQLAHAGRQTLQSVTGQTVVGASSRRCRYFRQRVRPLDESGIMRIIGEYADAAYRAQQSGFDGVQIHAAHGYLVHQFLSPWTNVRRDSWREPHMFLQKIIEAVRARCGRDYPVLVKLSAGEDSSPGLMVDDTIRTVQHLESMKVDGVEISYGTMEYALNIIRGGCPIDVIFRANPLFHRIPSFARNLWRMLFARSYLNKFVPFTENYNVPASARIRRNTNLAVFPVGGIRSIDGMIDCMTTQGLDGVSLCRPLICEPDLVSKIRDGRWTRSECTNCNLCTVHADSRRSVRCYQRGKEES